MGGVAGLAIIVGLLWFFMRRRTHKQSPPAQLPTNEMSMGQHQSQPHGVPSELDGHQAVELDGQRSVSELPSCKENTLHELPVMEKGQ